MKHLLRIGDLTKEEILAILDRAEELRSGAEPRLFPRKVLGLLFFQPSTRTRFGFAAAMAKLGGTAISLHETKFQPGMTEAESLEDTLRSIANYCDAFVLRHPDDDSIDRAAAILTDAALINGGNGTDEHPTQALIDLFAIRRWHGRLEGLRIGLVGDLARSRAAHSLLLALRSFPPAGLRLMHPSGGEPPARLLAAWPSRAVEVGPDVGVKDLDVLYLAGLPEGAPPTYDRSLRRRFALTAGRVGELSDRCVVLDPLPRIDEIDSELDQAPNARFFEQSTEAHFVRTAMLEPALQRAGPGDG